MKLASAAIRNFRAIEELELDLHPQLTVLHGGSALGKTSVLRALAVGLGAIPRLLPGVRGTDFADRDRRRGTRDTRVALTTVEGDSWVCGRWAKRSHGDLTRLRARMKAIVRAQEEGRWLDLPIAAFYDTDRAVLDLPQRRRGFVREFPRFGALEGALTAHANFRELFQWFYFQENEELRQQKERRDFDHQSTELRAVRTAITSTMDDVSDPQVRLRPLRFEVTRRTDAGTEILDLAQLSDGYRAVLALVMDLARRMAQANPHLADPLRSEAVVLIDEVELHLRPSWQQRVLADLTRTFPNAEFVVTTHSPQVLTTVHPEQVVSLEWEEGRIVACAPGGETWGAEAGEVLAQVMGVEERPRNEFSETLERYLELVDDDQGETDAAMELRRRLDGWAPRDPDLIRADVAIRRHRTLRRLAEPPAGATDRMTQQAEPRAAPGPT